MYFIVYVHFIVVLKIKLLYEKYMEISRFVQYSLYIINFWFCVLVYVGVILKNT